jgi:hypothetical protein
MCSRHSRIDVMPETHLMPLLWRERRAIERLGRPGIAAWLQRNQPRVNPLWGRGDLEERLAATCDRYRDDALGRGAGALVDATSIFSEWLDHWRAVTDVPRPGEKTPSHIYYLPTLLDALPDAQAIVMHRDPRAAGCSEWLKHQSIDEPGRGFTWFRFAVRWASSVEVGQRCEETLGPERVLQLRYEDVVGAPEATGRRVCRFLGESFEPDMVQVGNLNTSYGRSRRDPESLGIDGDSVHRWRGLLEPGTVEQLEDLTGRWMARLGYEPETGGPKRTLALTGWGVRVMSALAGFRPASFNQLVSRTRYPGLRPRDHARRRI